MRNYIDRFAVDSEGPPRIRYSVQFIMTQVLLGQLKKLHSGSCVNSNAAGHWVEWQESMIATLGTHENDVFWRNVQYQMFTLKDDRKSELSMHTHLPNDDCDWSNQKQSSGRLQNIRPGCRIGFHGLGHNAFPVSILTRNVSSGFTAFIVFLACLWFILNFEVIQQLFIFLTETRKLLHLHYRVIQFGGPNSTALPAPEWNISIGNVNIAKHPL